MNLRAVLRTLYVAALVILCLCAQSPQAYADEEKNPYLFGGSCASNGYWTNTVLQQAQAIQKVIEDLASDPNCKALTTSIQTHLSGIQAQFDAKQNTTNGGSLNSLGQTSTELSAIGGSLMSNTPFLNRLLANSALQKQVNKSDLFQQSVGAVSGGANLAQRTAVTFEAGLGLFDSLATSLGNSPRCLSRKGEQAGQMLASSVYMLAAFAQGGESHSGARIAQSISKLSSLMQDRRFAKALARIDNTFLQNSMRCLLEVTAESYCSIKDNIELLKLGMKTLSTSPLTSKDVQPDVYRSMRSNTLPTVRANVKNPFAGIYVLSRHLPNVTSFLQKVMLGIDPNTEYEASQKNDIMEDVNLFMQSSNNVKGIFYRNAQTVRMQATVQAQQQAVVQLLGQVLQVLQSTQFRKMNFFFSSRQAVEWPFLLISMPREDWPASVISGQNGMQPVAWDVWMRGQISGGTLRSFDSPKDLLPVIERNLLGLLDESNSVATDYYRDWFLADKSQLIDEMFTDPQLTVADSLTAIDSYLSQVAQRIIVFHGRPEILNSIQDTRVRIRATIDAVQKYGQVRANNDTATLRLAAGVTLSAIYQNFNVLQSRSSFLSSRVSTYAKYDYKLMIDNGLDMTDYQRSLVIALGQTALSDMQAVFNQGPEKSLWDLQNAHAIVQNSLGTLEQVFIDDYIAQLALVRLSANDQRPLNGNVSHDSNRRLVQDSRMEFLRDQANDSLGIRAAKAIVAAFSPAYSIMLTWNMFAHGNRYPHLWNPFNGINQSQAPDTEYGASKKVLQMMCIQSLAFNNYKRLSQLCQGVTLGSVFEWTGTLTPQEKTFVTTSYDLSANKYLKAKYINDQDRQNAIRLNYSNRICALRNHLRNNFIYSISVGRQQ